jgi:hypothetical protein
VPKPHFLPCLKPTNNIGSMLAGVIDPPNVPGLIAKKLNAIDIASKIAHSQSVFVVDDTLLFSGVEIFLFSSIRKPPLK